MYLAGVSTRQVDDTGRLLWGERMPSQTLSDKPRRVYEDIDQWRNHPLAAHSYPYLFVDGVRRQAHVGRVGRERECVSMLLYIVKGFGVLGWLVRGGDGLDPEGGASFEFG